jgi:hypothetical protein
MADDAKMLIEAAAPVLRQNLFQRSFDLDDACGVLAEFMFTRYGVSNYGCTREVKAALEAFLEGAPDLRRVPDAPSAKWQPAS